MKKILSIFLVVLTLVSAVVPAVAATSQGANLSASKVEDDLKLYNPNYLGVYYADYSDTGIYLITMQEDGYSSDGKTPSYALYFYLYNPSQKTITSSDYNKIQLANKWKDGEPVEYTKYAIDLVSISANKRFIKVKLSASKYPAAAFCCTNKDGSRSYSVSGIELYGQDTGADISKLEDYFVAQKYTFSGYSTSNNLSSNREELTTISLDVHQTSYLTGDSGKKRHELENGFYSNQVNSVYFSIPEEFEKSLGNLYAIDYEYYQYRTAPILVTDNDYTYETLKEVQAKPLNGDNAITMDEPFFFYDLLHSESLSVNTYYHYGYSWGDVRPSFWNKFNEYPELGTVQEYFTALLKVDDLEDRENILISSDDLQEYFKNYAPLSENGVNIINHSGKYIGSQRYNGDLFDLDYKGFDENYVRQEWTAEDTFSLPTLASQMSTGFNGFIKNWFKYGWDIAINKDDYNNTLDNVQYIKKVTSGDILKQQQATSDHLLISYDDVTEFRDFFTDALRDDEVVYLLRYAASDDYYYLPLETGLLDTYDNVAMVQETVYLDFDIIDLSFKDSKGKVTVIPVVSAPTDGFTGPENITPEDATLGDVLGVIFLKTDENGEKGLRDIIKALIAIALIAIGIFLVIKFWSVIVKALSATLGFVSSTSSKASAYVKRKRDVSKKKKKTEYKPKPKKKKEKKPAKKNTSYSNAPIYFNYTTNYNNNSNYKRNKKKYSSYGRNRYYKKK